MATILKEAQIMADGSWWQKNFFLKTMRTIEHKNNPSSGGGGRF